MTVSAAGTTGAVLAAQTWTYEFTRPRRMGWPTIPQTRSIHPGRPLVRIAPTTISVTVRRVGQQPAEIRRIAVTGYWASTRRPVRGQTLAHEPGQYSAVGADAPGWVMDLAAEAISAATAQIDGRR